MKKIGVYLLHSHHTFLADFIKMEIEYFDEIHLFTTPKIVSLIYDINPEFATEKKIILHLLNNSNYVSYNKYVSVSSENLNKIIISPVFSRMGIFSLLFLKPKCETVYIDVSFGDYVLNVYNFFHWDIITNWFLKQIYVRKLDSATSLWLSSRSVIKQIKIKWPNKPLHFIPFNFYKPLEPITNYHKKINITTTGGIESARKDFEPLFKAIDILIREKDNCLNHLQFTILGSIKSNDNVFGIETLARFKAINNKLGFDLFLYFEDLYISEHIYREHIQRTDILLNTIATTQYQYGKMSSGMSETMSYGIPGIYPWGYEIVDEFIPFSILFKDEVELANTLKSLTKNQIESLRLETTKVAEQFSIFNYKKIIFNYLNN